MSALSLTTVSPGSHSFAKTVRTIVDGVWKKSYLPKRQPDTPPSSRIRVGQASSSELRASTSTYWTLEGPLTAPAPSPLLSPSASGGYLWRTAGMAHTITTSDGAQ